MLGDAANYLIADATISVEFYGSEPVGIELPQTVDLKVVDTVPGIKGATASAQVKPATLETGLVVRCPRSSTSTTSFGSIPRPASICEV